MAKYDLIVISNPELSKNATKELIEEITSKIKTTKGQISSHQSLGVKKFASPIKKNGQKFLEGAYDSIAFEQESKTIQSFTSELRFNQSILKFQIVHSREFDWEKLNQVPAQETPQAEKKDPAPEAQEETPQAEKKDTTPEAQEETPQAEKKDPTPEAQEETPQAEKKDPTPEAQEETPQAEKKDPAPEAQEETPQAEKKDPAPEAQEENKDV